MGEVVMEVDAEERKLKKNEEKDGSSEVVRWERFLPRMVLRVLLVEADDSTRQIISALLRKCGYEGFFFFFLPFILTIYTCCYNFFF